MIHYVLEDDTGAYHIVNGADIEMDNIASIVFTGRGEMSYAMCQSWIANIEFDED
jgi:hypothetical protein